jgi:hypothetical protein
MAAIEPTLVNLLTTLNVANTPDGEAAVTAFNAAQKSLANWQPGTSAQTVIEGLDAFSSVFAVLPIPADAKALESIITAGIVTVIGVVTANSPAPAATATTTAAAAVPAAAPEETQAMHVAAVVADTTAKVTTLVPEFTRSIFTAPAHQYKNAWNHAVGKADKKYAHLKQ